MSNYPLVPLKRLVQQPGQYGANVSADKYALEGVRFLRTTDLTDDGKLDLTVEPKYLAKELVVDYQLNDGDILFSRSGTVGRAFLYVRDEHPPSAFAGYLVRFRPSPALLDSRFLYYTSQSAPFQRQIAAESIETTIANYNAEKYGNTLLPAPQKQTQQAIANFLDEKTAAIDALIAKKGRLIALLEEKRAALINQAVTRGLDPDVPMKDSGVPWIGQMPVGWELIRLKFLGVLKSGDGITSVNIHPKGTYPVFGGNGIRGFTEKFTHHGTHILIGRQGALCGNIHTAEGRFWASEHAVVVTVSAEHNIDWLAYMLETMNLNQYSVSSAQPGLAVDRIRELSLPVPSQREQRLINNFLSKKTESIDFFCQKNHHLIERLVEYRQSLITAAVTGQIDINAEHEMSVEAAE